MGLAMSSVRTSQKGRIILSQKRSGQLPIVLFLLLLLLLAGVLLHQAGMRLANFSIMAADEKPLAVILPHHQAGEEDRLSRYQGEAYLGAFASSWLNIVPDDCLEELTVNGRRVALEGVAGRCDSRNGAILDLGEYLRPGANRIEALVLNKDDGPGLAIAIFFIRGWGVAAFVALAFSLATLFFLGLRGCGMPAEFALLVAGSLVLSLCYLSYTNYNHRAYDEAGHIEFIEHVVAKHSLPGHADGWESHQAPLYYLAAAAVQHVAHGLLGFEKYKPLQLFSLFCFLVFSVYGGKTLLLFVGDDRWTWLYLGLFLFWPASAMHSIRVGNDVAMYALSALTFYYICLWQRGRIGIYPPLFLAMIGLQVKTTAIISFMVLGGVILAKCLNENKWREQGRDFGLWLGFGLLGIILSLGDNLIYLLRDPSGRTGLLAGNSASFLNERLFINNNLLHYLSFDLHSYLLHPFTNTWDDLFGRQYFWNFLFKTALFGEFTFSGPYQYDLAMAIGFLFLGLAIFGLVGFFLGKKEEFLVDSPMLLLLVGSLSLIMAYKIKVPVSCHGDFRFGYPMIIAFVYYYRQGIGYFQERGLATMVVSGLALGVGAITLVLLFYLSPFFSYLARG